EGERASTELLQKQRQEIAGLQNGILDSLQQTLPRLIQETESALINLALESAQKVVAGLPVEAPLVEAVVREALRQIEDTAEMVVQLHPEDLALLQNHESSLLSNSPEA